jgi:hypothetical protein
MAKKKAAPKKKTSSRKKAHMKSQTKATKAAAKGRAAAKRKAIRRKRIGTRRKAEITNPVAIRGRRGLGSDSGGQSGDTQGLSRKENFDSESVEELSEEGQSFEAEAVSGVENAKDPDQGEVTTTEVPEDDVPSEYTDRNKI